ncbi:polysaccharide biosynthesis protein [Mesorhizobium sp. 10J20-29]
MYLRRLVHNFIALPRGRKKFIFVCFDVALLLILQWVSFSLRLKVFFVPNFSQAILMIAAPAIALPVFIRMGLYRSVLRYLPERAIWTILQAASIAALGWVGLVFLTSMTGHGGAGVPRSTAVIYWLLSAFFLVGSRFGMKWLLRDKPGSRADTKRTLIYGTGRSALQLTRALTTAHERTVFGFISDDASLQGMDILGIRVYPLQGIPAVIANFGIDEIIVTTPSISSAAHRDLVQKLSDLPVRLRILPAIADLADGKYSMRDVRDIDIDDLLRRSPVPADPELMRGVIEGRVILITGAAGSIGSALSRTVAKLNPQKLILMDFNEYGLYEIGREIAKNAGFPVLRVLGSVTNPELARRTLRQHRVETVYHCAAFKHVPIVETNCIEGVRNNVLGTWTIAEAAHECGVKTFVLISSDKAVRPANVMGATKRWAELIIRHFAALSDTETGVNFSTVRFGNVIGSSGSVVPLFKEQIAAGGPVTLTHEEMTRYFMSVREAAELIIQASALSKAGDVLLLEMGDPVRIRDLAQDMIMLAGLTVRSDENPDGDIEILTIGAREGEKLHEELVYEPSGIQRTRHPKILRARRFNGVTTEVPGHLSAMFDRVEAGDEVAVRQMLFDFPTHREEHAQERELRAAEV